MIVREEAAGDGKGIDDVVEAAFGRPDEARIVDRLRRDGDAVISLVAIDANEIIGHMMLSRMTAPFPALGLAPVAVTPKKQRQGVGDRLIREGLDRAQRQCWDAVFVLGKPGYYRRFGFDPALAAGFASPYSGPHLMALALGGALPITEGAIAYAPAFSPEP